MRERRKIVRVLKSGKDLVIRIPKAMKEELGLGPGHAIAIEWDPKTRTAKLKVLEW